MLHTVIFIGRSGSGKGTQAELLRNRIKKHDGDEHRQIIYIETGARFRSFIREDNYTAKLSHKIYETAERQPDFLAVLMWGVMLIEEFDENMHLVFDGMPRSKEEAEVLTTALKFYKRENATIIFLDVSREWSEKRLLGRGRSDDVNLSKIDKRLDWFDQDVLPAIEYFKNNSFYRVLEIDGEQSPERVHSDIIAAYDYSA